jgi:hypothetical protein
MSGHSSGSAIVLHMTVPNARFVGAMSSCSMAMDGQATMSSAGHTMTGPFTDSLSGMMSGWMMNQSSGGAMNNGQFALTR